MHTPSFIPAATRLQATPLPTLFMAALSSLVLVACGGGGSDTPATGPNTDSTGSATGTSIAIQTTVPEPPLAIGTPRRQALDYLNRQRLQCGFGALRYNSVLEETGTAHSNYVLLNAKSPQFHPHTEVAGLPGYTAPSPT